jgi:hypothetical protein
MLYLSASMTCIEITGGKIQIVRWRVVPNENGLLRIERNVMRGPERSRSLICGDEDTLTDSFLS